MHGVGDALAADPRAFVFGEDVGGQYGNAFLLLRPLLDEVRRSHPQLAARRRRGARRLRRRRARRAAADRRDAVQRLRRHRLQSARQQRGEDPVPLGRLGADGRAHAVGRPAPRRPVSLAEHRAVVLPHAGTEDRRAVDAARRARADGGGGRRSRSGALLRAHRALSRSADQAGARRRAAGAARRSGRPRSGAPATTSPSFLTAPTCTSAMRVAESLAASGIEASVLDLRWLAPLDRDAVLALARHTGTRAHRPRGLAHGRHRRVARRDRSRKRRSSGSTRPSASSARSTRPCRTRRRSKRCFC